MESIITFLFLDVCGFGELIMSDNTVLHLGYTPMDGLINEAGADFLAHYNRRYYPRNLSALAVHMRNCAIKLVRGSSKAAYKYSMLHYTEAGTTRFTFEECIKDATDDKGFQISIQPSTAEEKEVIAKCQVNTATRTKPVADVIAYLEDSLENEADRWINAQTYNKHDVVTVLTELIHFLKDIKTITRVMEFNLTQTEDGMELLILLISPTVFGYYTRIDWKII